MAWIRPHNGKSLPEESYFDSVCNNAALENNLEIILIDLFEVDCVYGLHPELSGLCNRG